MLDLRAFSLPGRLSAISLPTLPDPTTIPPAVILSVVVIALILLVYIVFVRRVIQNLRLLRAQSREGRRVSAELSGPQPLTNFTRVGVPSDPLNIKLVATEAQLATAFAAAGWLRADELAMVTAMRITVDSLLRRAYPSAPVSSLYLYGRPQDFAFQRPGTSARERDHVRFWDTGECASDERPIWIGGATRDVDIELSRVSHLPTHRIAPDVDAERDIVLRDLVATGWVIQQEFEPGFGRPVLLRNANGHEYVTDGRIAVIVLADVPVLLPLATETHGPLAGGSRAVSRLLRWALPKRGRKLAKEQERAEEEEERERETAGALTTGRSGES
jgi:hypothetical protein